MTYTIIGGDGREYGPVTDADLRKWIAEGRLNAQSLAKAEGEPAFHALATFHEFAEVFGISSGTLSPAAPVDWGNRDYQLDIGGSISRGWTLFMDNIGILLGSTALYLVIFFGGSVVVNGVLAGVLSQIVPDTVQYSASYMILQGAVLQVVLATFAGPLAGGYYYVFIRTLRGENASVGDLFSGFQKAYSRLFAGLLINNLLLIVCWIPFNIVFAARAGPLLMHMKHMKNPAEFNGLGQDVLSAMASSGPIALLCLIPGAYLATNLWFSLPLMIDRGMDVWTAIGTSWKLVHRHWFTVFGLVFLLALINLVGLCLCCVGLFFTVGITTAASMLAYETIFCERRPSS